MEEQRAKIRQNWDDHSDTYYDKGAWAIGAVQADPTRAFPGKVFEMIRKNYPDLRGKRVLVPSSGDNIAVFGFHLLGAQVTSCDISPRQIENARGIATKNGWEIDFRVADSMQLNGFPSGWYDLVYTSNGVHVWIDDLPGMYAGFSRVLRPGGRYILFETHPMIRPFDDKGPEVLVRKHYADLGPSGDPPTYAWRTQDFLSAMLNAGFRLETFLEFHSEPDDIDNWFYPSPTEARADGCKKHDWRQNPWAALPQWLGLSLTQNAGEP